MSNNKKSLAPEAIFQMLKRYELNSINDYKNAIKEIVQEIALLGLWRAKFFEKAAFYGGTALRILYKLDRFSEDLQRPSTEVWIDSDIKHVPCQVWIVLKGAISNRASFSFHQFLSFGPQVWSYQHDRPFAHNPDGFLFGAVIFFLHQLCVHVFPTGGSEWVRGQQVGIRDCVERLTIKGITQDVSHLFQDDLFTEPSSFLSEITGAVNKIAGLIKEY